MHQYKYPSGKDIQPIHINHTSIHCSALATQGTQPKQHVNSTQLEHKLPRILAYYSCYNIFIFNDGVKGKKEVWKEARKKTVHSTMVALNPYIHTIILSINDLTIPIKI